MSRIADRLLATGTPFLAVCLSHQLLSRRLSLPVRRCHRPHQGVQRKIDLFGTTRRVGSYNTFAAYAEADHFQCAAAGGDVLVSRTPETGEVHALRGPRFASLQFHAESVLTSDGLEILADCLNWITSARPVALASRA
jgi:phenazine biosynthesis protein phzE